MAAADQINDNLILSSTIEILGEDECLNTDTFCNEDTSILLDTLIQLKGECFFNVFIGRY